LLIDAVAPFLFRIIQSFNANPEKQGVDDDWMDTPDQIILRALLGFEHFIIVRENINNNIILSKSSLIIDD